MNRNVRYILRCTYSQRVAIVPSAEITLIKMHSVYEQGRKYDGKIHHWNEMYRMTYNIHV